MGLCVCACLCASIFPQGKKKRTRHSSKILVVEKYSVVPSSQCGKAVLMESNSVDKLFKNLQFGFTPLRAHFLHVCIHIIYNFFQNNSLSTSQFEFLKAGFLLLWEGEFYFSSFTDHLQSDQIHSFPLPGCLSALLPSLQLFRPPQWICYYGFRKRLWFGKPQAVTHETMTTWY